MAEITYYFNAYDVGGLEWDTLPAQMVDGNTRTAGYTNTDQQIQLLTGNTCAGTDLGTISKVEIRICASKKTYTSSIDIIPVFVNGDGDSHNIELLTIKSWREYVDITTDTNNPGTWVWTDVQDLQCKIRANSDGGILYCFEVEIRVTYSTGPGPSKRTYKGIPLGVRVRGQIGKDIIFRVRRGSGHQGSNLGEVYQDRYDYFVPSSINNSESAPYRTHWAAAVDYWKNILTDDQKQVYNKKAVKGFRMSGYNLFMRAAMKGEIAMYTDRGDPASYDFDKDDLTKDAAWHDLDLSTIVPSIARAVFIIGHLEGNAVDWEIRFRKKGNTNDVVHSGMETIRANVERHRSSIVAIGSDQTIQYKVDNEAWTTLDLAIKGWWT